MSIRPVRTDDAEVCARILHEAFKDIDDRHGFPPEFDPDRARRVSRSRIENPSVFGIVAEARGRVIGFCFMLESDAIRGLGPICVDPYAQARSVGRRLMTAALEQAQGAEGIRLVQVSYNTTSLALYASLGFEVREPLVMMRGKPSSRRVDAREVRPMTLADINDCGEIGQTVHGFSRTGELRQALGELDPLVVVRDNRVVGYISARSPSQATHGVAVTEDDLRALLVAAGSLSVEPYTLLVPTRQTSLFHWCLAEGFRIVRPTNLMAIGAYQEPQGCWFPSILY